MNIDSVGIIGGGAWGTALAQAMRRAGRDVVLWAREADVVAAINGRHVNEAFLPGVTLDKAVLATGKLADAAKCDAVLFVAPAQYVRPVARELRPSLRAGQPVVMCAKGIEQATGQMMGDVLAAELPAITRAVLSGPSFAADVARGLPAALTIACADEAVGRLLAERLGSSTFRLYWTNDLVGVELGGAVKNVLAIAAGIVDGQGLGASAHAALVTRGFAEMRRLGKALGARPETLIGLSGLGDLILTCGSPQSRNMSLGRALGRGETLAQALAGKLAVTEGVYTAAAVRRIAEEKGVDMPICTAVCDVIDGRASVMDAIGQLMQRPLKAED
ncbi:MAG: NAD(P)-dependent glycerol-3-phosphate dehydrogenase [Hyphomicrobium sp.]|uniref:NAD(P)H-dependent glycerol-3-phosphate dehydrogenase n=1 Tax=Hyphomicrobium sp. TaxID=82 RepID=UPI00132587F0|nr:NAD(P)H-dependent glycerol-3-phosphate dehydrogenase [Hyphomicrobium sp.]KAB2939226.1 MAG: NAD(P)-dependent glycerol-3-phosphate dehydrogenase [Hyphomicrobium sp.]MBZ0210426.1 NAD(P)-dependent glycerol-3-phosphate dehydrogenase [Hyphomicrobium sp.]